MKIKIIRYFLRFLFVSLIIYMIVNMTFLGQRSWYALYKANSDLKSLKIKNKELIASNKRLKKENKLLENDPFTIKKVAREKYGLGEKGDLILKY